MACLAAELANDVIRAASDHGLVRGLVRGLIRVHTCKHSVQLFGEI